MLNFRHAFYLYNTAFYVYLLNTGAIRNHGSPVCQPAASSNDLGAILPAANPDKLATLPNILHTLVHPPKPPAKAGKDLPKSKIGLQKASLLTFQSWLDRDECTVGMLFGKYDKGGKAQSSVLAVANSYEEIWHDPKIKTLQTNEGVIPLGVVLGGCVDCDKKSKMGDLSWEDKRHVWCSMLIASSCKECLFILVSYLNCSGTF